MSQPKPSSKDRVRAHRERMRAKGLRPVTIWAFGKELREQVQRDIEAINRAETERGDAWEAAQFAYAATEAMLQELDETEPYDWGPDGPPK